jgi:HEAT repeat protein
MRHLLLVGPSPVNSKASGCAVESFYHLTCICHGSQREGKCMSELQFQSEPVSAWLSMLDHPQEELRRQAAAKLLEIGAAIAEVLPGLTGTLSQANHGQRARAAQVLGDLGTKMLAALPTMRAALRNIVVSDSDADVRTSAAQALALLGPDSQGTVSALVAALKDPLPFVRLSAAHGLAEQGVKARDAVPALTHVMLYDTAPRVRLETAVALWRIDRRAVRVLPVLIQALDDADEAQCWVAADCLGDMGAEAHEAVPALQALLRRPPHSGLIRMSVGLALQRINPEAEDCM